MAEIYSITNSQNDGKFDSKLTNTFRDKEIYEVDIFMKYSAYAIEAAIAGTSFVGSIILASKYSTSNTEFFTMLLAPFTYSIIELSRVQLAISARTQNNLFMSAVAIVGLLFFSVITVKSMSQLGEMMFHPRIQLVTQAKHELDEAKNNLINHNKIIDEARLIIDQRKNELNQAESRMNNTISHITDQAPETCHLVSGINKHGRKYTIQKCSPNPVTQSLITQQENAKVDQKKAIQSLNEAQKYLSSISDETYSRMVTNAEVKLKKALSESQIHSFAAMFYGKDNLNVSDDEVWKLMRLFVFIPAISAAFAASVLAASSVTKNEKYITSDEFALTSEEGRALIEATFEEAIDQIRNVKSEATSKSAA